MTYNYSRFKTSFYDLASFEGPGRGEQMPNLELMNLDGNPVHLSDLWDRPVVLETGSITCPMYAKGIDRMGDLAERYPRALFAVLYVREAHPGEKIGPHADAVEKLRWADALDDTYSEQRMILVDSIDGTAHTALGSLPNMVYVIEPGGRIVFRGDWNEPSVVEQILAEKAGEGLLSREHFPPAKPTPKVAFGTLLKGGVAAVADFIVGLPGLMALHRKADRSYQEQETVEA